MKKLACLFTVALLFGCKVETGTDESSRFQIYNYGTGEIDFSIVKDKIFTPQCLQCHSWANNETEVIKRIIPGNPANSSLFKIVKSGQMPQSKPRLTDQSLTLLEQYILNLNPSRAAKPVPLTPTYASLKVNLFEKSCMGCHNADEVAKHEKRPLLTTKEAIIDRYDDILYSMTDAWNMLDNEMPPQASSTPRVNAEVIKAFTDWRDQGFAD